MFTISIGHLLSSFPGDNETHEFEGEVPADLYEDVEVVGPLKFNLTLIALDEGIEAIIRDLDAKVMYEGKEHMVSIDEVGRTFLAGYDPLAPDDVRFIDMKHHSIDLTPVIREELIMATY